jgi:formylglycine-generating enzyme required for sulfatase activity
MLIEIRSMPKLFLAFSLVYILGMDTHPSVAQEKSANAVWVSPSTQMEFIKIPGGCFLMGSNNGFDFEAPAHKVCVDSFYLGKYEVTQKQWSIFQEIDNSKFKGDNHPAQRVSWNDAKTYLEKLNKAEKTSQYRLPTEAEWEYAARGGTSTEFFWGDKINNDYVWYFGTSNYRAHPVGLKKTNPFGLYDILGNVWEWVEDWFSNEYFKKSPIQNPQGPKTGRFKVKRGGSQANLISHIKSHTRYRAPVNKRHYINGFRIALSIPEPK